MFWKRKPYSVKLRGRSKVLYREENRQVSLSSEFLGGEGPEIVIYLSITPCWDSPNNHVLLTKADLARIQERVEENLKCEIEWA